MTLDQLINIYRKVQVQAADGSLTTTRTDLGQSYARVQAMRGSERDRSDQTEAQADYVFSIHYRTDLIPDDIIVWNGWEFNVRFIADNGQGSIYLTIEAQRGVAV